jgi:hypothetical protein
MHLRVLSRAAVIALLAAGVTLAAAGASTASASSSPLVTVIARHLNQPKKLTLTTGGDLVVALSGDGKAPSSCTDSDERSCEDASGAVDEITPDGHVSSLLTGLTSISSGVDDPQATGPVQARIAGGRIEVLYQDLDLSARTGISSFGAQPLLGDLVSFTFGAGRHTVQASFGPYEARHEPDRDELGSAVTYGYESAINSDPYSFVPYRGGEVVADAGANDVLWVTRGGQIKLLAVLPTIRESAVAGTFGSAQKRTIEAEAQSVPSAVAIGPDGAIYVGELGGAPFDTGTSDIYRIVPGQKPTVYATGFTAIGDLTFDSAGRLLVLEIDKRGLNDPGADTGHPASGEVIRVSRSGAKQVLVSRGLPWATGIAVDGAAAYVSIDGVSSADDGHGGEVVRVRLG